MGRAALWLLQVLRRRIYSGENRNESGQGGEEPTPDDHGVHLAQGHAVIIQQGLVYHGVVAVQGDAGQVEDGGSAEGHVHGMVALKGS